MQALPVSALHRETLASLLNEMERILFADTSAEAISVASIS
jgi:hypothetical protein